MQAELTVSLGDTTSDNIMQEAADVMAVSTQVYDRHQGIKEPPVKRAMIVTAEQHNIASSGDEVAREGGTSQREPEGESKTKLAKENDAQDDWNAGAGTTLRTATSADSSNHVDN